MVIFLIVSFNNTIITHSHSLVKFNKIRDLLLFPLIKNLVYASFISPLILSKLHELLSKYKEYME